MEAEAHMQAEAPMLVLDLVELEAEAVEVAVMAQVEAEGLEETVADVTLARTVQTLAAAVTVGLAFQIQLWVLVIIGVQAAAAEDTAAEETVELVAQEVVEHTTLVDMVAEVE